MVVGSFWERKKKIQLGEFFMCRIFDYLGENGQNPNIMKWHFEQKYDDALRHTTHFVAQSFLQPPASGTSINNSHCIPLFSHSEDFKSIRKIRGIGGPVFLLHHPPEGRRGEAEAKWQSCKYHKHPPFTGTLGLIGPHM